MSLSSITSAQSTQLKMNAQLKSPLFGSAKSVSQIQAQLADYISELAQMQKGMTVSREAILQTIRQNKPISLPAGVRLQYGILNPDGTVESPYPELQLLASSSWKQLDPKPAQAQPILLQIETPEIQKTFNRFLNGPLKQAYTHTYTSPASKVHSKNVILTDLIEKLISGKASAANVPNEVLTKLKSNASDSPLSPVYQLIVPGNAVLQQQLNDPDSTWPIRQKLLGLEIAKKLYSESQEVEWQSIALSLALGVIGEPTINHVFKDGGTTASVIRTSLMSGVDIMGNILSVAGVAKENLKEQGKALSLKSVYGQHKTAADMMKAPWDMSGEAGPLVKQGIKAGGLGGLIGILFNVPAGAILSMPNADVAARAVIGGIGAAGSAVAIPPVIQETKKSYEASIEALIRKNIIRLPNGVSPSSKKGKALIEKMALKEMNARIGIASSIKATHPLILATTGGVILAGEKLGIPRQYVQTAYMALAPVMHNFLRLVVTGWEKCWVIPRRMKALEQLVRESKDKPFDDKQVHHLDQAFLSSTDQSLSKGVSSLSTAVLFGSVLLAAEVLYFSQAFRKHKELDTRASYKPAYRSTYPTHFAQGNYYPPSYKSIQPVWQTPISLQRGYYSQFQMSNTPFQPFQITNNNIPSARFILPQQNYR